MKSRWLGHSSIIFVSELPLFRRVLLFLWYQALFTQRAWSSLSISCLVSGVFNISLVLVKTPDSPCCILVHWKTKYEIKLIVDRTRMQTSFLSSLLFLNSFLFWLYLSVKGKFFILPFGHTCAHLTHPCLPPNFSLTSMSHIFPHSSVFWHFSLPTVT